MRGAFDIGGNEAAFPEPGHPRGMYRIVALVVDAVVLVHRFPGRLYGPVGRRERQVTEERAPVTQIRVDVLDHPVGVEGGGVEVLGQGFDHPAVFAVRHIARTEGPQHGEVPCPSGQQREGLLEAPRRRALIFGESEVPFARHVGVVTRVEQDFGDRRHALVEIALVARQALKVGHLLMRHDAHAGTVIVDAGEKHSARRRTQRGAVETRQQYAFVGQRVDVGRGDLAAVSAEIRVAHVVHHDQQHVGGLAGGRSGFAGRPGNRPRVLRNRGFGGIVRNRWFRFARATGQCKNQY